jgi:hypothetical protein
MDIKVTQVTNLSQYTEVICDQDSKNSQDLILFRGHRSSHWKLQPKIGRDKTRLKGKTEYDHSEVEQEMFNLFRRLSLPFLTTPPRKQARISCGCSTSRTSDPPA